jgi:predicted nucleotide-binding protein
LCGGDDLVKPALFIGSSEEAMSIVDAFQSHLEGTIEVIPWRFGVFKSGESALESLVNALDRFDFAAFILTPDDLVQSRGHEQSSPRDNVIFEMGLFIGRLGRERVFVLHGQDTDLRIPTDLRGINTLRFGGKASDKFDSLLRSTRSTFRELEGRVTELKRFASCGDVVGSVLAGWAA